ncbi:Hypothetical protein PMT_2703 [Prochlorococcus marinus str. MIT 9313]|uniref:Uncharacterized protein n=1 Tax=Prochlorococcus marinus (strain MIT 9313) TaxID=74547 RepID=B9ES87_PROMM|nr:Hypothetical protein PMT_2703 [Prochlorococcus marinus str. MIT 9313]
MLRRSLSEAIVLKIGALFRPSLQANHSTPLESHRAGCISLFAALSPATSLFVIWSSASC